MDLVVVNDVSAPGVGFDHDTNEVTILGADGSVVVVPLTSKRQVADVILDQVVARLRSGATDARDARDSKRDTKED
ncbi:MAG: hypothetical protein M0010_00775 [Actinomycetota bacterium]|nr:hypothetical protein [Actinomycetota bacterium]